MAEFKHLIRIANPDLDGKKTIAFALSNVKGVGTSLAHAACRITNIDLLSKCGDLSDEQIKKLDTFVRDPVKFGVPAWLLNRRKDPDSGEDMHLITNDLIFVKDNDIKMLRRIKCYRGVRHSYGLPSRGQRTRSNFRRNKGKVTGVKTSGKKGGPSGG